MYSAKVLGSLRPYPAGLLFPGIPISGVEADVSGDSRRPNVGYIAAR